MMYLLCVLLQPDQYIVDILSFDKCVAQLGTSNIVINTLLFDGITSATEFFTEFMIGSLPS